MVVVDWLGATVYSEILNHKNTCYFSEKKNILLFRSCLILWGCVVMWLCPGGVVSVLIFMGKCVHTKL